MTFTLNPQLESDTLFIDELPISRLLLMNDNRIPWFILVPRKPNITEIYQLDAKDQIQLFHEISSISKWAQNFFQADKINMAALGNVIPQLHIHIIARYKQDFAWPKPVWGIGARKEYPAVVIEDFIKKINISLSQTLSNID